MVPIMNKTVDCKVLFNKQIANGMYEMALACDTK
jgi:hypothetical protein